MFDKEFVKEQIKAYLTADLKNILKKRASKEYVPEYYELVETELKARGEDPKALETESSGSNMKIAGEHDALRGIISKSLKEKLNIANLELEELVQLYVWESKSPYFMSLVEGELIGRGEDIKKYVKPGPLAEETSPEEKLIHCNSCGKDLAPADNFCSACGNPKLTENI
ncbi:MAG: hypothetical protein A2231_11080 [Candidatus Firestonebacteria bacterium RIFOXYA2_FULL_40_8]|nr:MAG: hypothetical protein A2231_11080 [Candidatus Firestonebacteria bacterium RIFOXYA2_FULL_40_8]